MMIGVLLKVSSYNVTLRIRSFLKSVLLVPSIKSISISDGLIVVRHFFNGFDLDIVRFSIRKKDILWEESNFGLMNQDFLTLVRLTLKILQLRIAYAHKGATLIIWSPDSSRQSLAFCCTWSKLHRWFTAVKLSEKDYFTVLFFWIQFKMP